MRRYACASSHLGFGSAGVIAALWNPSSVISLYVVFVSIDVNETQGTYGPIKTLYRITTQGTPGATVTPDADNAFDRREAPPSGAVLNTSSYSVAPTLQAPGLEVWQHDREIGERFERWFRGRSRNNGPKGIRVPPGTGLAWHSDTTYGDDIHRFTWVWDE